MSLPPARLPAALAAVLAALLLAAPLLSNGAAPAFALTNCDVADLSMDSEERAFLTLINDYRAQNGLGRLTVSVNLNRAASWMAVDMGAKNYFSHVDSLGRTPSQRARDCGSPGGAGENIAAGTNWSTAQQAFDAWRNSSGHNANMLYSYYRQIGIARAYNATSTYKWYWVTNFSTIDDGTDLLGGSTPTPTPTRTPTPLPPTATPTKTPTSAPATATPTSTPLPPTATPTRTPLPPTATPTSTSVPPTATPTRTPVPPTPTPTPDASSPKAVMISPAPGSALPGSSVTFSWTAVTGARDYQLYIGTTPGGQELLSRWTWIFTRLTVRGLPTDGRTLYVRLWTRTSAGWAYNDYVYTAARQ